MNKQKLNDLKEDHFPEPKHTWGQLGDRHSWCYHSPSNQVWHTNSDNKEKCFGFGENAGNAHSVGTRITVTVNHAYLSYQVHENPKTWRLAPVILDAPVCIAVCIPKGSSAVLKI